MKLNQNKAMTYSSQKNISTYAYLKWLHQQMHNNNHFNTTLSTKSEQETITFRLLNLNGHQQ